MSEAINQGEGIIVNFEDRVNNTGDYACVHCPGWTGKTAAEVVDHINTCWALALRRLPD